MVSGKQKQRGQGIVILLTVVFFLAAAAVCQAGLFWGPKTVVSINDENFSTEDVRMWWENWQEEGMSFPDTARPFVNWQLLAREAEKMGLDQEPSFKHKIEVFLKVRSLLRYEYEKINSKIEISDDMLRRHYREKYLPRLELAALYFNDRAEAEKALGLIRESGSGLENYARQRPDEKGKTFHYQGRKARLPQLEGKWRSTVKEMSPGEIAGPVVWKEGYVIIELKARKDFDSEDFEDLCPSMREELGKEIKGRLTEELVEELKDRYNVSVDREIFRKIDIDSGNKAILDKTLISIGSQDYPVRIFLAKLKEQEKQRRRYNPEIKDQEAFKKGVLNGMISQTLTSRAALDEHYEREEPLKPIYQFYRKHRLIKELEKRLFEPGDSVSDEEIRKYYQEHAGRFSRPGTVTIALLEDEQKLIDKMYGEIKRGLPFYEVADRYYSGGVPEETMQFGRLHPRVKKIINDMATGEVSRPFDLKGRHAFLKLVSRSPAEPMPLEHVKEKIVSILEEKKFNRAREEFLATLRSRSDIKVNEDLWAELKTELGNSDAKKEN